MNASFAALRKFWRDEDGAVTVDWVVLTAAIVAFGMIMVGAMSDELTTLGDKIGAFVGAREV